MWMDLPRLLFKTIYRYDNRTQIKTDNKTRIVRSS